MILFSKSKAFVPTEHQSTCVKQLNDLRNEFIHFVPRGRSIDVYIFPELIIASCKVIDFLVNESGNVLFYKDEDPARYKLAVKAIQKQISKITEYHNTTCSE